MKLKWVTSEKLKMVHSSLKREEEKKSAFLYRRWVQFLPTPCRSVVNGKNNSTASGSCWKTLHYDGVIQEWSLVWCLKSHDLIKSFPAMWNWNKKIEISVQVAMMSRNVSKTSFKCDLTDYFYLISWYLKSLCIAE